MNTSRCQDRIDVWRKFASPEILFAFGGFQSLSPYLWWALIDKNPDYAYQTSYIPVVFWISGYLAFLIGCRPIFPPHPNSFLDRKCVTRDVSVWRWKGVLLSLIAALGIQGYYLFSLYGGIPILLFLSGESNVFDVNEVQTLSGFGQLGAFLLTLFALQAILLVIIVKAESMRRPNALLILTLFLLLVFLHISAGKRQGVVMLLVFLGVGLAIAQGNPIRSIFSAVGIQPKRWLSSFFFLVSIMSLVSLIEGIGLLRVNKEISDERPTVVRYLELPLINIEAQIEAVGTGPARWEPRALLSGFVPAKWQGEIFGDIAKPPELPEPTSPTGFFGPLQWFVGLPGTVLLCLFAGMGCKTLYRKAHKSLPALLCYSQVAWALVAAHSYNHFLGLLFFVVPSFVYVSMSTGIRGKISFS